MAHEIETHGTQAAAVFWAPSVATDVASYRVLYGPSTGQYDGTNATEGQSPITVPAAVYAAALMVGSAVGVFRNAARAEPAPQPAKPKEPAKS